MENSSSQRSGFGGIQLMIVGQNGDTPLPYLIKMNTKLIELKTMFTKATGIGPISTLRFMFDGNRIGDDDTPKQLGMVEGDVVEVYSEQTGG